MGPFSSVFYVGTGLLEDKVHLSAISCRPLFPFPLGFSQQYSYYRPLSDSTEFSSLSGANEERGCQVGQNGIVFLPLEPQCGELWEAPLWGLCGSLSCHLREPLLGMWPSMRAEDGNILPKAEPFKSPWASDPWVSPKADHPGLRSQWHFVSHGGKENNLRHLALHTPTPALVLMALRKHKSLAPQIWA